MLRKLQVNCKYTEQGNYSKWCKQMCITEVLVGRLGKKPTQILLCGLYIFGQCHIFCSFDSVLDYTHISQFNSVHSYFL